MRPGRGAQASLRAAVAFIAGLVIIAFAAYANSLDVSALVVWGFGVLGLIVAVPVAWFQLFD